MQASVMKQQQSQNTVFPSAVVCKKETFTGYNFTLKKALRLANYFWRIS
ncbi:hypothetical protein A343_0023 [Porphyromonas gingivalis JCVI SC001]|nr:hypothetical protein A343_0023 [Porphyromonas gingivalis JCVI SC001]